MVDRYNATVMNSAITPNCKIHGTIGKNNVDVAALTALKFNEVPLQFGSFHINAISDFKKRGS